MNRFIKKVFTFITILFAGLIFISCEKLTDSQKFLKDYEAFVVSAEKAADNKAVNKIKPLIDKEAEYMKKAAAIGKTAEWTIADAGKFTALSARFTAAEARLTAAKAAKETGEVAKEAGKAAEEAGKETGKSAKEVGKEAEKAAKEAGKALKDFGKKLGK
ncbi:MAG: hypothetical protein K6F69_08545 [Treponema sp.]|nr:hypothetical protein [Treponema sp.]